MSEDSMQVKQSSIVEPAISAEKLVDHMKKFQELKSKLLDKEDVVSIQGKPFVKRSGWRKIALAFNISDEIVREEKQEYDDHYTWRITVKASAPNGRYATGVGACSSNERSFTHGEHDIYAIAHTRAKNRAISDLVGSGEVSAEEIEGLEHSQTNRQSQPEQNQQNTVEFINIYRWKVKNTEFPLTIDSAPYGWFSKSILKPFQNTYNIRFYEETNNGCVTYLMASKMQEEQYKQFMNGLAWSIKKLANCQDQELAIITEEIKQ